VYIYIYIYIYIKEFKLPIRFYYHNLALPFVHFLFLMLLFGLKFVDLEIHGISKHNSLLTKSYERVMKPHFTSVEK
jgi:hypothetical protein